VATVATGRGWEIRLGRWQDVLADVERADALITDTPYSERTHKGHNKAVRKTRRAGGAERLRVDRRDGSTYSAGSHRRRAIEYPPWTPEDVAELVAGWHRRVAGWFAALSDHELSREWERAAREIANHVTFPPLPCIDPGCRVRLAGDGPSSWTEWLLVSRRRSRRMARWGTLPGWYSRPEGVSAEKLIVPGGKPLWLMRAIVSDYSRRGDLVVDPCAGGGTTLLAATLEGRRAIGAEVDRDSFEKAVARLQAEQARMDIAMRQAAMFPKEEPWRQCALDIGDGD
jgi:site-specific DNA-methyltransferase (adenine-specific)